MLILGDIPVMTTVYQVLVTLQRELQLNQSRLLQSVIPPKNDWQDIQITCPYHKHGLEHKPSCGITAREKKRNGKVVPAGVFYCFSCSARGDITELISHCFGREDGGLYGKQWILDHFNDYDIEKRDGFFKKLHLTKEKNVIQYVSESELEQFRYIHSYMYKRYLTDEIIDIFDIGYDKSFQLKDGLNSFACITFPVKDIKGNVVFIARRSIKGKIFHYPRSVDKPIYGLWETQKLFSQSKELYICESILNALMFVKWGKPAVALLGTGTHSQIEMLKHLDYRKYILCLDSDEAGEEGVAKLTKALNSYKFIDTIKMPKGKDVNDLGYCKSFDDFLGEINKKEVKYYGKNES